MSIKKKLGYNKHIDKTLKYNKSLMWTVWYNTRRALTTTPTSKLHFKKTPKQ